MENPENIIFTCKDCNDKRKKDFRTFFKDKLNNDSEAINNSLKEENLFIKGAFFDEGLVENMWLKVTNIDPVNETVTGKLDNEPIITRHKFGQEYTLHFTDLMDILMS